MDDGNNGAFSLNNSAIPPTTLDLTLTYLASEKGKTYRFYLVALNVNGQVKTNIIQGSLSEISQAPTVAPYLNIE
jgi:hypothetical protein